MYKIGTIVRVREDDMRYSLVDPYEIIGTNYMFSTIDPDMYKLRNLKTGRETNIFCDYVIPHEFYDRKKKLEKIYGRIKRTQVQEG